MTDTMTTDIASLTALVDTRLAALAEADTAKRAEMIAQAWAEDGSITDPPLSGEGHAGLSAFADAVCQHYAGHTFRRTSAVDLHHDRFRYSWELVAADGSVTIAGIDVGDVAADGRMRTVTGFFGDLPPVD